MSSNFTPSGESKGVRNAADEQIRADLARLEAQDRNRKR